MHYYTVGESVVAVIIDAHASLIYREYQSPNESLYYRYRTAEVENNEQSAATTPLECLAPSSDVKTGSEGEQQADTGTNQLPAESPLLDPNPFHAGTNAL
eukprot:1195515-Prorocentrum_minimum.AAC.15